MKYRIKADLIFNLTGDGSTFFQTIKNYSGLLNKIINLQATGENSFIELEECHHDETPPQPCKILQRIEK